MIIKFSLSSEYMHIYWYLHVELVLLVLYGSWGLNADQQALWQVILSTEPSQHGREIREDKWRAEYDQDIKYILYTYEIVKK